MIVWFGSLVRLIKMYLPSKDSARNALSEFIPKAGREYSTGRNYDLGPDAESTVSKLSPYMRTRLLPEWEVLTLVLKSHSAEDASKFIDEVCWRTYWKGWLQLRPSIWDDYRESCHRLLEEISDETAYRAAIEGRTGIDCFDAWANELVETHYLHNHARMWFASIWIHTLKLPWELGADWFLRHLIDGDPASNTLSWRWVAGLQTQGKTYLARPDNIKKYTNNRFEVTGDLAAEPIELDYPERPNHRDLPQLKKPDTGLRLGHLIKEEDLSAAQWIKPLYKIASSLNYFPAQKYRALNLASEIMDFRRKALEANGAERTAEDLEKIVEWARAEKLEGIVVAEPTIGHWPEIIVELSQCLKHEGIEIYKARHWWDETLFPHATHGFFRFKKAIPMAVSRLTQINANQ